jgi:bifunctional non-homologous end joining protein LigD
MATRTVARRPRAATLPKWIAPQLTQLVDAAPEGSGWLHEIKFDGYPCMRASIAAACGCTRTGLDWTNKYPAIREAMRRSSRARPISTASCAAWAPTASPLSA